MSDKDLALLKELCALYGPAGDEGRVRDFLIQYIKANQENWKVKPQLIYGDDFQDCLIVVFGQPRTAIYAHMDSVGYTIAYDNALIKSGGPKAENGSILIGEDAIGPIRAELKVQEEEPKLSVEFDREIERGTPLVYEQEFSVKDQLVQSCYLDNRLGIWNALKVAETLENGALVFSTWEEVGGGSVPYLGGFLYQEYGVRQALISDITWATNGVHLGKGVAISMRDSGIPRRSYIQKIKALAKESGIPHQLEVESAGGSDGNALQASPYPIDWCFIGAAEQNVHQPNETAHLDDIETMHQLYSYLMKKL